MAKKHAKKHKKAPKGRPNKAKNAKTTKNLTTFCAKQSQLLAFGVQRDAYCEESPKDGGQRKDEEKHNLKKQFIPKGSQLLAFGVQRDAYCEKESEKTKPICSNDAPKAIVSKGL